MTNKAHTLILNRQQIEWKLQRMAYQVWEQNSDQAAITLIGIADNGLILAQNLAACIKKISPLHVEIISIRFNKIEPLSDLTRHRYRSYRQIIDSR